MTRNLVALLTLATLVSPSALAQAPGRWGCRADSLSGFNCAGYYSGTVTHVSELRGPSNFRQTLRVTATVTGGRVTCQVAGSEVGELTAPGMIAVTHESSQTAGGGYSISVWCPTSADDRLHRGTSPFFSITQQRAADYGVLEGRDAHEHPDTDAANGMSGTETITWALRRP